MLRHVAHDHFLRDRRNTHDSGLAPISFDMILTRVSKSPVRLIGVLASARGKAMP